MYASDARFGHPIPGERYVEITPKVLVRNHPLVSFVHAAGADGYNCLNPDAKQSRLTQMVCADYVGVSGDNAGPQTWGNDASINALSINIETVRQKSFVHDTSYALVANSMGALVAINYAAQAAIKPKAIALVIPVISTNDIKESNRGGYAYLVDAAYGGAYNDSIHGDTHNPHRMRSMDKLKGIPFLIFYGRADTVCIPHYTEEFIAADPTVRTGIAMPYGHDYDSYNSVDQYQIAQFLRDHLK
jgi:pimeloyl-ACP methyl ester carboxylesterase